MIRVWDQWIRLFHWSLVLAVCVLLVSGETGAGFYDWHRLTGEIVLALIVFRIFWGFIGSSNVRLRSLFASPVQAIKHLQTVQQRKPEKHRGHNKAGSLAALAMLCLLLIQAATGMFIADEDELVQGAFFDSIPSSASAILYTVHHYNAHLLQIIIVTHILAIAIYLLWGRQNLTGQMISGKMHWPDNKKPPAVSFAPNWLGFVALITAFIAIGVTVGWF